MVNQTTVNKGAHLLPTNRPGQEVSMRVSTTSRNRIITPIPLGIAMVTMDTRKVGMGALVRPHSHRVVMKIKVRWHGCQTVIPWYDASSMGPVGVQASCTCHGTVYGSLFERKCVR